MISRERIIKHIDNLPTLPTAVVQLSKLISSPDSTAKDFEEVIKPDPALTANLLRLANSAYFGLRREVTSVRQAITLLGNKRVFEIAASAGFSNIIPPTLAGYGLKSSDFWLHSVAVAILSESFARHLKIPLPELQFTAGLLHDIGKLAVSSFLVENARDIAQLLDSSDSSFIEAEKLVLGTTHEEVGEEISKMWDLPDMVSISARWHHSPSFVSQDGNENVVILVHIADIAAHLLGYGTETFELKRKLDRGVSEKIGFDENCLEVVSAQTRDQIAQMACLFK